MKPAIGIIGGTGVNNFEMFKDIEKLAIDTEYGIVNLKSAKYKDTTLFFLERHGKNHCCAPHEVNYRANISALKLLGVERIIATAAVGSINKEFKVGSFVIIDDFIDFTKSRKSTFFENTDEGILHIDMSEPYCPELRSYILSSCASSGINANNGGTYICTEGPRFETKAEIRAFSYIGADVVGMTNVPEVVLAREKAMCYATVAMVTNYAAGISKAPLTHREVIENMRYMSKSFNKLLLSLIEELPEIKGCACEYSTREQGNLK